MRSRFSKLVLVALFAGVSACNRSTMPQPPAKEANPTQQVDGRLTFKNVLLEQAGANGQPLWRIGAKQATYSEDRKIAQVQGLSGELFQNGKSVFRVKADRGDVLQGSQKIFLKGQIVATDVRDGTVLQARELEWRPEADLLFLRQDLRMTHPQMQISAKEARASSRTRQVEAQGQVVATLNSPSLRIKSEHMVWQIAKEKIIADSSKASSVPWGVQIERSASATTRRFSSGDTTRTPEQGGKDRAWANQAVVSLSAKTATLQSNARLSLINPPLEIASRQLTWNLNREFVNSPQPIQILHRDQNITVTANQGNLDLNQKRVQLTGSVQAVGQRNSSLLRTDQLTWLIPTQEIAAQGNVVYRQNNPQVDLRGPKAIGKFQQQAVVISGGRVVTEVIP